MSIVSSIVMGGGSGGSSEVLSRTTTLTAAQLADLYNTPVELVPAPGEGKFVQMISIMACYKNAIAGGTYTGTPGACETAYTDATGEAANYNGTFISIAEGDEESVFQDAGAFIGGGRVETGLNAPIVFFSNTETQVLGAIATTSIGAAGTGYEIGDEIYIGDAVLTVATVGGGGEVLTYTLTTPGTNNILGDGQATTTDSALGADFTLDIDSLDYSVNPMTLKVKVLYSIFDLS